MSPPPPPASVQIVAVKHFEKIGMSLKVMETEGKKIRAALINLDLTGNWWHHDATTSNFSLFLFDILMAD